MGGMGVCAMDTAVSLADLPAGSFCEIAAVRGGGELRLLMAVHGIAPGALVRVLRSPARLAGGLIVQRGRTRLALGRDEALKIEVRRIESGAPGLAGAGGKTHGGGDGSAQDSAGG